MSIVYYFTLIYIYLLDGLGMFYVHWFSDIPCADRCFMCLFTLILFYHAVAHKPVTTCWYCSLCAARPGREAGSNLSGYQDQGHLQQNSLMFYFDAELIGREPPEVLTRDGLKHGHMNNEAQHMNNEARPHE